MTSANTTGWTTSPPVSLLQSEIGETKGLPPVRQSRQVLSTLKKETLQVPESVIELRRLRKTPNFLSGGVDEADFDILKAVEEVVKNKPTHKDNVKLLVERKRQILMMQMKIDQKKEQIKLFEEKVKKKNDKLRDVEARIARDEEVFEHFHQENLRDLKKMIGDADKETKMKLEVVRMLKGLAEMKIIKLGTNSKLLEKFQEMYSYKEFLDEFKPEKLRSIKLGAARADAECQAIIKDIQQFFPEKTSERLLEMLVNSQEESEEKFFFEPAQLPESYRKTENENLFLIQENQKLKVQCDEALSEFQKNKQTYEQQSQALKAQIEDLTVKERILAPNRKFDNGHSSAETQAALSAFEKKIAEAAALFDIPPQADPISLLKQLEYRLIDYSSQIALKDKKSLKMLEKFIGDETKKKAIEEQQAKEKLLNLEKREKLLKRGQQKSNTRRDLFRSHVKEISKMAKASNADDEGLQDTEGYFR